jgi:hypothetical protein
MTKTFLKILFLSVVLSSCNNSKMDYEEIKKEVLGTSKGIIADIEIGSTWQNVKDLFKKDWEVDETSHKLIKTYDKFNNVILQVGVDRDNIVRSLSLTINGEKINHLTVEKLNSDFEKKFNEQFSPVSAVENWGFKAPNGDSCGIIITLIDQNTLENKTFNIKVYNLSTM